MTKRITRREFLRVSAAAGGGLLIGLYLPGCGREQASTPKTGEASEVRPNAWLRIGGDDSITVMIARSEMGQGVVTSMSQLVAEELEVGLDQITTEFAPVDKAYANKYIGSQLTGGSTSVRDAWSKLRMAGASARELLVAAAAETWGVAAAECRAERGTVIHRASDRRLSYGAVAARAATLPVPEGAFLKEPHEFTVIGKPLRRLDTPAKTDGSAQFGIDVRLPGMLTATVVRCPVFGGRLKSANTEGAEAVPGVRQVLTFDAGVAVVADGFWAALKGRRALEIVWDEGEHAALDSAAIRGRFMQAAAEGAAVARSEGNAESVLSRAARIIEAEYDAPYQAHACMEPMNCTADVRADACDVWVPTQAQTSVQRTAMQITGLPETKVQVHTTFLGGGFGRRAETDYAADAVAISKAVGRPVQVIWTREDDVQHDFYRPAAYNRLRAVLDEHGSPVAWWHRIAGPSIFSRVFPGAIKEGVDHSSVEGAANLPYAIPNIHVDYAMVNPGVPVGFWRSVGSSQNAYVTECFLDELAKAGGQDPYTLRRKLLANAPRHLGVLDVAAHTAGWGESLPAGRFRGIAVAESFESYVAQVAEVSVSDAGQVRVHRVVCAIDCGMVVNPDIVKAQMESAIAYGLTATLKGHISIDKGRVVQSNFHDFPLLRMDEMPEVEVVITRSTEEPGGVGEPGTPPIAPAVANAVFAATGRPIRRLPIRAEDLRGA